ncbi:hypothetical protein BH11PLA1_BH11PLA1_05330 [soil metagenome]
MRNFSRALAVAAAASLTLTAGALAQQAAYAIGGGGSTLVSFNTNNPGAAATVGNFTLNGTATFLDALDFRPQTGQVYGYLSSANAYYTVNLATGALTLASANPTGAPTNTFQLGMDFNPTIDRLRVVTDSGQNIVFNPNAGTAAAFTTLAYALGDTNENTSPMIIDNAYTNSLFGAATTQQYGIDYGIGALVTIANNAGTLGTVGALGVSTSIYSGFDIFTVGGTNTAYALLSPTGGAQGFYTINLATGAATLVGATSAAAGGQLYSLAIVPTPGVAAGLLAPLAVLGLRRRRSV